MPITELHDCLTCPLHHSDIPIFWSDYHNDNMYVKVQEINNFVSVATCDRSVFLATKSVYARDSSITFLFFLKNWYFILRWHVLSLFSVFLISHCFWISMCQKSRRNRTIVTLMNTNKLVYLFCKRSIWSDIKLSM